MPVIRVIRHSKAIANEQGILMGRSLKMNSNLSEEGIDIAHQKGRQLKASSFKPDKVYCSRLNRSIQTAEIILLELGLSLDLIKLADLDERDFGEYEGRPYKFVLEAFANYESDPPTVEPAKDLIVRVLKAFEHIKTEATNALVISHSSPVMVMQAAIFYPDKLDKFWELGGPKYCEGFNFSY